MVIATSKSASYKHMTIPSQPLLAMYVPLQSKGCTYLSWLTSVSPHRKRSLTQKCLRSGRHITEVKEYYKHFHHSLVWVEQSLKSNQTRINKSPSLIPRNRENCCPKMPCHFLGGFIPFKAEQQKGIATKIFLYVASIISKLQNTFSVCITVLRQHESLIRSPSILVLRSWKYKISFWISGPWISLFIISFQQSSYQSFNRKTQLHSQLIVDV